MPVQCTCSRCGKTFPVKPSKAATSKTCSWACRAMGVQLTCLGCGRVVTRRPSQVSKRNYCCRTCMPRTFAPPPAVEVSEDGLTARVPMLAKNGSILDYATIDADLAEWAQQWTWRRHPDGYAYRTERNDGDKWHVFLHREILGLMHGVADEGDHINRIRTDDRRINLRPLPKGGNGQNQSSHRGSSSQYRGVTWHKACGKWMVQVVANKKHHNFGCFISEDEAGAVARRERLRLMPYATD